MAQILDVASPFSAGTTRARVSLPNSPLALFDAHSEKLPHHRSEIHDPAHEHVFPQADQAPRVCSQYYRLDQID
jgi:hypothetical protein